MAVLAAFWACCGSGGMQPANALEAADGAMFDPPIVLTPAAEKVAGVADPCVSLCGQWQFHSSPPKGFFEAGFDASGWKSIAVPGEWFMQGFEVPPNTAAGYRRTFRVPKDYGGMRVKLRFDAVYSDATVWVNGHEVGHHLGGFTPFEFDVTRLVRPGADNTLAMAVRRESVADLKMTTFGTAYIRTPLGGVLRKITLRAVPTVHVAACHVATTLDREYRNATLQVMLRIVNQGETAVDTAAMVLSLADSQGKPVGTRPKRVALAPLKAGGEVRLQVDIPVAAPSKWDCEHPNLYTLRCDLLSGEKPLESVRRRVGFRQIEVRGRQLMVNGLPVKLRGVCRHERHATLGRSLTPELWRKDIELFREANINLIRTSHYPPPEGLLDVCDELGMFVEVEAPFHHAQYIRDAQYRRLLVRQTAEMVEHHRNHPSVLIWSLGNEATWSPHFEASAAMVRRLDPTRPRLFAGPYVRPKEFKPTAVFDELDIDSFHYPGLGRVDGMLAKAKKPLLFDEYCHLNCYNLREQATDPGIRDDWGHRLVDIWERMYAAEACLGGALWGGIDEIVLPPAGPPAGWGAWGLIDAWHRRKPEHWHAKKAYSPVRIGCRKLSLPADEAPIRVPITNRHDFTNLNELRIAWTLQGDSGNVTADIPPRSSGELLVRPSRPPANGDFLQLEFHSPRGFLIDEYCLALGDPPKSELPVQVPKNEAKLRLTRDGDSIRATGRRVTWEWDAKTGQLREAKLGDRAVLCGGPHLMLLPRLRENYRQTVLDDAKFEPFTSACSDWECTSVEAETTQGGVRIDVDGRYREAEGTYRVELEASGGMTIRYRFAARQKIDPRQIGLVVDLPRQFDTITWQRDALWTVYPADHIGRIGGSSRATRGQRWPALDARQCPPWPWASDETALGTNDFRATRTSVLWAALADAGGRGVLVDGDGRQAVRTWLEGERVRLLVADYSLGSGEVFLISRAFWKPRQLSEGTVVEGCIRLWLAEGLPQNKSESPCPAPGLSPKTEDSP